MKKEHFCEFVTDCLYSLYVTDAHRLAWQSDWLLCAEKKATEDLSVLYLTMCFVSSVFIVINKQWHIFCNEQEEKAIFLLLTLQFSLKTKKLQEMKRFW